MVTITDIITITFMLTIFDIRLLITVGSTINKCCLLNIVVCYRSANVHACWHDPHYLPRFESKEVTKLGQANIYEYI